MEGKGGKELREDERKRENERVVPQNKFLATSLRLGQKGTPDPVVPETNSEFKNDVQWIRVVTALLLYSVFV